MKSAPVFILLFSGMWFFMSCGSTKPFYGNGSDGKPSTSIPSEEIRNSCFLVGGVDLSSESAVLDVIQENAEQKNSLILLGDVISVDDLPSSSTDELSPDSPIISNIKKLDASFDNFYLIPGEKEWTSDKKTSSSTLQNLDKALKDVKDKHRLIIPAKDCGIPEVVRLADHTLLVLMDSEWAIESEAHPGDNLPGCELANVLELRNAIKDIIQSNPTDHIVFASHHPLYANGPTAGNYPLSSHLLPLPILGTLITGVKSTLGSNQHFGHPNYEAYRSAFLSAIEGCRNCVVISGHEKSLQYFSRGGGQFMIAGSGQSFAHARKGERAGFSFMSKGFARVDELKSGSLQLSFYAVDKNHASSLVWKKILPSPLNTSLPVSEGVINDPYAQQDSIVLPASTQYEKKHFLRGEFYRKAWSAPVKMQVLHLDEVHGGLMPLQLGGGNQTRSLRLVNKEGQQFVLRSIDKKVTIVLPPALRGSFAENIVQEGIAASHPYGALVVPKMAEAAGVFYTNPSVVYVPHQSALGIYDKQIGDGVYLFEERPGGNTASFSNFGNTEKTYSTAEVVEMLAESHKYKVDQQAVLRARLFDVWLGDWDRHDDQVRWAAFEEKGQTTFRPIPRDRDQVFYKNDGVLDYLASRPYFNPPLRLFKDKIDHLDGLIWAGKYFDRSFLHELTEQDFIHAAEWMQNQLTDEIIKQAFRDWPAKIDSLDGDRIRHALMVRRNDLVLYAKEYYNLLAEDVFVPATSDRDIITINTTGPGLLELTVDRKEGDHLYNHFHRIFDDEATRELRIFGLNKQDSLSIVGNGSFNGKVRFVGGSGKDKVNNQSAHFTLKAYDELDGMTLNGSHVQKHFNNRPITNTFDRTDWNLDRTFQFIVPTYYTDQGVGLHYTRWWTKYGFRADPYKSKHAFGLSYFFGTSGLIGTYKGNWIHALGEYDLGLELFGSSPAFTQYWYGPGNTYVDYDEKKKYHIVEGGQYIIAPSIIRRFGFGNSLSLSPSFQYINIEEEQDEPRFINTPEAGLSPEDFGQKQYLGLIAAYKFSRLDNPAYPTRGIELNLYAGGRKSISDSDEQHALMGCEGSLYLPFDITSKVVLATHVQVDKIVGDHLFFHSLTLAGERKMRGYLTDRFAGDTRFFHATDLRVRLLNKRGVVPFQLGIYGSFDYGRVWNEEVVSDSEVWHTSVGGGLFIVPLGIAAFRMGYMKGAEDVQITIGGSLKF